jgi:ABC-type Mn2+/Zn2+ transport system permease subunit
VTFLLVSLLMAIANFTIRKETKSSATIALAAIFGLLFSTALILYYEFENHREQLYFILGLYLLLTLSAWGYARFKKRS